jgi:serine/threonine protein kinase
MSNPLIGKQLANFRLEHLLGQGGMAEVYFGRDISLQRPVAVKVINARFRDDPAYAERFISEARAVAAWRHEHIVQVYYAGEQDGLIYFVMEYIDGMDLATLIKQYAAARELIPVADVLRVGRAVASALDYAHAKGVIHRDVKPANTMIATDGRVVLMDFGLALNVQQGSIGEVFGTPHYVAPEQARNSAEARPQSDVYSLGIMMFEMLTGALPFDDPSPTAVALQHLTTPPPSPRSINPALNEATEAVLLKALAKDPAERYQTATEFMNALEAALAETSAPPADALTLPPDRSFSGRTISEHVAQNLRHTRTLPAPDAPRVPATAAPVPPPPPPTTPSAGQTISQPVLVVGALVAGAILMGLFVLIAGQGQRVEIAQIATTEAPTATDLPPTATDAPLTATTIPPTATDLPPSDTPIPSPTPIDTSTPIPTPTPLDTPTPPPTETPLPSPSPLPTETPLPSPTPLPTETPIPSPTPLPTETPIPLPTVLFPDGRRVSLVWNDTSFYWHNPTNRAIRVSPLDFEPLDANGTPAGSVFNGRRWTLGFNAVEPNRCVAIELLETTGYLRPDQCQRYNSIVTLVRTSRDIFWVEDGRAVQFRVLWEGQEVGRCLIAARSCEVFIP